MRQSKIFTNKELELLQSRLKGLKSDPNGMYSSRIKPKLEELYNTWFPMKRKLSKLLKENKKNESNSIK